MTYVFEDRMLSCWRCRVAAVTLTAMLILLHSSKTMVTQPYSGGMTAPQFAEQATELHRYLKQLTVSQLQAAMHISANLAGTVRAQLQDWESATPTPALYAFRGDIYSGLRAADFTPQQVTFAQDHVRIMSGLYGMLRPLDGIAPYRLEAGYKLPDAPYNNLYACWGDRLAASITRGMDIINVTSDEYARLVMPYLAGNTVIAPRFLTRQSPDKDPVFVVVHAKIARGAFARWLIKRGQDTVTGLEKFNDLGYAYDPALSTPQAPVYICNDFGGIGLSQRVTKLAKLP